jgi:hypothetical protein
MDPKVSYQAGGISVTAGPDSTGAAGASGPVDAAIVVTALYADHALGLTRLALIMVGDRQTAEDIVQDAFCGCIAAGTDCATRTRRCPTSGPRC